MRKFKNLLLGSAALIVTASAPAWALDSQVLLLREHSQGIDVSAISDKAGYSNQPWLTAKGVYYTQAVTQAQQSQTDIFFYDFATNNRVNVTQSKNSSEYSPTMMLDGDAISAVVVEPNAAQKLWRYPLDGTAPQRIFDNGMTIGYHAWGPQGVLVFALGEPHSIHYLPLKDPKKGKHIVDNPGRTLSYNSALRVYTYTFEEQGQSWFATYAVDDDVSSKAFRLPQGVQDYTWFDAQTVIYANQNRLYKKQLGNAQPAQLWHDLSAHCQGTITRVSYLATEKTLAWVCNAKAKES